MADLPLSIGICASRREVSCVLRRPDGALLEDELCEQRGAQVAQSVQRLCAAAGYRPAELGEIRIDIGPGSYTGLRVAVTFARILLDFAKLQVYHTTSLELLALCAWREGLVPEQSAIRPVLDARRNRYHTGCLSLSHIGLELEAPRAIELDPLLASIQADYLLAEPHLHERLAATARDRGATLAVPPAWSATDLYDPRLTLSSTTPDQLEPLYLMGSYAE